MADIDNDPKPLTNVELCRERVLIAARELGMLRTFGVTLDRVRLNGEYCTQTVKVCPVDISEYEKQLRSTLDREITYWIQEVAVAGTEVR